ncbi:MAG TPA: outer membrane protein transport protein [Longimicrobium sp.]|nr:outer membrane protein transport protein [Longimicrobium sp.]
MRRSLAIAGAAAVACAAAGTPLHAQGSSVDQQSACMAGRVGAGVAMPCDDGSAVYFSPAGLAHTPSVVSAGVALVRAGGAFEYDSGMEPGDRTRRLERETANVFVPQGYINFRASDRLAVGIGVLAPYGLGLEWPVCEAETPRCGSPNFEGRFTGYDNSIKGLYIQPTVAFQLIPDRLSVGAGFDYVRGDIEVHRRQFGPEPQGLGNTEIADVELKGKGTGTTYHVGGILRLHPRASVGVRYLGSAEVDIDGDATFVQVSTGNAGVDALIAGQFPTDQGVATTIEFPAQLVAGVALGVTRQLNLLADWQRTWWSSFDAFPVDFETQPDQSLELGYDDTNTFRFAADFAATEALALRAGFRYNEAATPRATPFLPEGERNYYTVGLGYRFTPALSTDFSFQYINQPDRAGSLIPGGPRAGVYEATGMVFNFTLAYRFGGRGR